MTAQHDEGRDGGVAGRLALLAAELEASAGVAVPAVAYPALETALCTIPSPYFPQPAPHAVETLQQIKALGLCTALVSNAGVTTAPTLRRLLEEHGMAPHLDALVFSDEVMVAKPHPVIFGQALRAVGAEAVQAVFVGDSPLNDIGGAQSAGIFAVQVGDKRHDSISPDASIVALDELVGVLRRRGLVATASGAVHD